MTGPYGTTEFSWRLETRRLWMQALPNIGMAVTRMLMGFIDFVMVSQLGTEAQAAIAPATFLVFVTMCFGMAIATTVTTFAAQAYGRGENREASAFAWQSLYVAAFFMLFSWPLMQMVEPLFGLFGHAEAVRDLEIDYCRIAVWCIGPSIAAAGLNGFFIGVQRPSVGLLSILAALVWTVIGNYALIFGHFGFPAMGMAGAAIATVGAWIVRAGMMMAIFLREPFRSRFHTRRTCAASGDRLRRLVAVGLPSGVQWFLDIGAWFVFLTWVIPRYGMAAMAASNVCWQYMQLSFMPAIGIGISLTSLVGHAIGEGRHDLAHKRVTIACVMTTAYMGSAGVLFLTARHWLVGLLSDDAAVIAAGAQMLIWVAWFQVFDGLFHVYNNALRGAGDTRWPAGAVVVTSWGMFVGGSWLAMRFVPSLGFHGPWLACTLYVIALGTALWWRFRGGAWRRIKLFHNAPENARIVGAGATRVQSDSVVAAD
ncbi:MAG: MATE family efflux transporter [Phycisphaerae bacterium]